MLDQTDVTQITNDASAERLSKRAYQAIRVALRSGEFRPGQRLILRPLAAKLGLSATPVREALLRLVSEQALGLDERNSVLVPTLGAEELDEIKELRIDLEGRAASVVAERATAQQVQVLEDIQARLRDAVAAGDRAGMLAQNDAFHHEILARANRPTLVKMIDALEVRFEPLNALLEPAADHVASDHPHERLLEALRARDPVAARAAIVADIENSFESLRSALSIGGQAA